MKLFKRIAIVGTGLIGGSLAMAIKKKKLANEIIGVSRHRKTSDLAKRNRIIDKGNQDIRIIASADLVILATPVSVILKLAKTISRIVKKDCIITDVGSTKLQIVSRLEKVFTNYVGAHPLAGSEKRSLVNARADIFKNSLCILTPTKRTNPLALKKIERLWRSLGVQIAYLSPLEHDRLLAFVSHLPHAIAFSLISCVPQNYFKFASSGLRDTTRIAASDNMVWEDVFLSNPKNILKTIGIFEDKLSDLKSAIRKKDKVSLNKILRLAKNKREVLG
jgi:prephenate dehydrogenase